jgi:hypothetical protein
MPNMSCNRTGLLSVSTECVAGQYFTKSSRLQIDCRVYVVQLLPLRWRKYLVLKYERHTQVHECIMTGIDLTRHEV